MEAYFKTEKGVLYCEDTFKIIENLPNEIDLILTDIPYVISRESNFKTMKDSRNRTSLDFGEWDKYFDLRIWERLTNLVKPNGSIVSFMSFEQYGDFKKIIESVGFEVKDRIIWEKTNPMPRNRDRRYIPNIELAVWAVRKGGKWTFNRQNSKYETSVLKFPSESGGGYKRYHPTQKPIALIEYLLKIHSNENDLVLDAFAGSGTTLLACEKLNRRWIGIEKDKKYCEVIKERITEYKKQKTLLF